MFYISANQVIGSLYKKLTIQLKQVKNKRKNQERQIQFPTIFPQVSVSLKLFLFRI